MSWEMHDNEFESVLELPGARRYAYFINHVADRQQLWSLRDNTGWVLLGDDEGHELVPVWPHPRFAEACATGIWQGALPSEITLQLWLERWIPGMIRDGRLVAVFPLPTDKGIRVSSEQLKEDLQEELARME